MAHALRSSSMMQLNTSGYAGLGQFGGVNGNALIYAPNTASANSAGFATVNAILAETIAEVCAHGAVPACSNATYVPDCGPSECQFAAYQDALKTALKQANNNANFVSASPCSFYSPY